jgi:hypothetical protein
MAIHEKCHNCKLNYDERRNWLLNNEDLYLWAKDSGVKI